MLIRDPSSQRSACRRTGQDADRSFYGHRRGYVLWYYVRDLRPTWPSKVAIKTSTRATVSMMIGVLNSAEAFSPTRHRPQTAVSPPSSLISSGRPAPFAVRKVRTANAKVPNSATTDVTKSAPRLSGKKCATIHPGTPTSSPTYAAIDKGLGSGRKPCMLCSGSLSLHGRSCALSAADSSTA